LAAKFEIYKGKIGDFHWRLTHTNGRVIAKSGEGYTTKVNAINGLNSVKKNVPGAAVEDRTSPRVLIISGNHKVERGLL
jgi:uncharacterized protein YegP (UPF0339 family)